MKGEGAGTKKESSKLFKSDDVVLLYIIVLFSSSLLPIKCTKKSKLTKKLSENACEEVQVTGNIVGQGRWKRFHDGVNTEHSLKKLHIQKMYYI